jgi:type III restriction enzyme
VPGPDGLDRTLIVEVSGGRKAPGPTAAKADTARYQWCPAVNNHGGFGLWAYTEVTDMRTAAAVLDDAIENLSLVGPVAGLVA